MSTGSTKPPEVAPAKPEKKELTQDEKDLILREAVSSYLRNNYITGDTLEVCQEFIDGVDKKQRAEVQAAAGSPPSAGQPAGHGEHHEHHFLERREQEPPKPAADKPKK